MYELKPNQSLLDLLHNARIAASDSVTISVHGELRVYDGNLCVFEKGELFRTLTLPEVVLLAAHDVISSPLCILAGNGDQARHLMRELRIHPKKAVILSHPSVLHRLRGMDDLIVIKYGTYLERRDFGDIGQELERRGAAFYFVWEEMLSELDDLRKHLDARGKRDAS